MALDDEKEIEPRRKTPSKDGAKIKKSLQEPTALATLHSLIKQKLPGNTLVFDRHNMYLLEGARNPRRVCPKTYVFEACEISGKLINKINTLG